MKRRQIRTRGTHEEKADSSGMPTDRDTGVNPFGGGTISTICRCLSNGSSTSFCQLDNSLPEFVDDTSVDRFVDGDDLSGEKASLFPLSRLRFFLDCLFGGEENFD